MAASRRPLGSAGAGALHRIRARVRGVMERCKPLCRAWSGVIYRTVSPRHFTARAVVSGEGSRTHGGRWNPKGVRAVHGSLTPETAMAEALRWFRLAGVPITQALPRVFVAVDVSVSLCLDLEEDGVLRALAVSGRALLGSDWRRAEEGGPDCPSQTVGKASFSVGREALLVPSAADPGGGNRVVFLDVLRPGSTVRVQSVGER